MGKAIPTVKGMHDLLPDELPKWSKLETDAASVFSRYGYDQIRTPILEHENLFVRPIGEQSDIVGKELYSYQGSGDTRLCMRPEGTIPVVRAVANADLLRARSPVRAWYMGPMFRRERPQKGRLRQFHQFGCEVLGNASPLVDLEVIQLCWRLWQELGIEKRVELQMNNLGSKQERDEFRSRLKGYFEPHRSRLSALDRERVATNPLRILDSKEEEVLQLLDEAPTMQDSLGEESRRHYDHVLERLAAQGVPFTENRLLVRGLDYYNLTVFEWVVKETERRQNAIAGGGRYDGLMGMIGARDCPGVGMAAGMERIVELMADIGSGDGAEIFLAFAELEGNEDRLLSLAEGFRDEGLSVVVATSGGKIPKLLGLADKSGVQYAAVVGRKEMEQRQITIKPLRTDLEQFTLPWDGCSAALRDRIKN